MAYNKANDKYRALWNRGNGPQVNGWDIDYSYFSPVEHGADPEKTYPLVVIIVGALEGVVAGNEMNANEMPLWSSEAYQSRFHNGGAFLMIPRAPEEDYLYWDASCLVESLHAAIIDFCKQHPCVDVSRIHVMGWCVGSLGAMNLTATYPEAYASLMIMCPSRTMTNSEAERLREMPIWMITALTDTHALYPLETLPTWKKLIRVNPNRDLRLTTFTRTPDVSLVPQATIASNHNVWDYVSEDMHFVGPSVDHERVVSGTYKKAKTIDGAGKLIEDPYAIAWMEQFTNEGRTVIREPRRNHTPVERAHIWFHEGLSHWGRVTTFKVLFKIYHALGWCEKFDY